MAITNATRVADFGSGIGTEGAVLQVDNTNNRLGVGTTNPQAMLQVGTGVSVYGNSGIVSATSFYGGGANITSLSGTNIASGTVAAARVATLNQNTSGTAANLSGTPDITVNNITGVAATFTGVLTYEDVTNVDSVGIVTARGGLEIGAAGVGGTITAVGNAILSGITTVGTGLSFADGVKACFGNAGDLQIYHDGAHSFIKDAGTGNLRLGANDLRIQTDDFAENYILGTKNGAVSVYYDNSVKLTTLSTGVQVTGVTSTTSLSVGPGVLQEKLYNVASALTGTVNFDVVTNGLVQYYTTNSSGTFIVNLRGDGSTTFNSLMDIGKTTVFTVYSAQNNASYYMTDFKIDGSSITEKWNGGTAPSAGTASGTDVYTFNIMKTADATFTVFATFSNFA